MDLQALVDDFATAIMAVDARGPVAVNQRTGTVFRPGIGPHSESETTRLVAEEMAQRDPAQYGDIALGIPYPNQPRQKCDLAFGRGPGRLFIEAKLLRLAGDNGKPNDNMLMHILSPYSAHRSAVTDCTKLSRSGFVGRKAIVIFGYLTLEWPLAPAIEAFEVIAACKAILGPRAEAGFSDLRHPVHQAGAVCAWEVGEEAVN